MIYMQETARRATLCRKLLLYEQYLVHNDFGIG